MKKPRMSSAFTGGIILLLASQRSGAVTCTTSTFSTPFVVEDTAGALQLASAINCSGGTFEVSWEGSVTVAETIRVPDGSALSVVGTPEGSSFVNGAGQVSLFEVIGGTLSLSGLSLINGNFADGGGGAIFAIDSVVEIDFCTFSDNVGYDGGAIFLENSVLDATESIFEGNSAGDGGAIYCTGSNLTISGNTTCERNSASDDGGVIHIDEFSNVIILGYSAWMSNSAQDSGGAVYVEDSNLNIQGKTFWAENFAVEDSGGAIYAKDSSLNVTGDATWFGNSAVEMGGAVSAEDCTFSMSGRAVFQDNVNAGSWYTHGGGGLGIDTSSLELSNHVEFIGNRADNGGGLCATELANITISGSVVFEGNEAEADGGGLFLGYGSQLEVLTMGSINFSSNIAVNNGGGVFCDTAIFSDDGQATILSNNGAFAGAGIYLGDTSSLRLTGDKTVVSRNSASSRGGGIYAEATLEFLVEKSAFVSNAAGTAGGAMSLLSVGTTSNAEASDEPAVISDCTFADNAANGSGGATSIAGGYVEIIRSHFDGNTAGEAGGAILASGVVELENCTFDGNQASSGSAVSNTVVATLVRAEFVNNTLLCDDESLYLDWEDASAYAIACDACDCSNCSTSNPDQAMLCNPVMEHTASLTANGTVESLSLEPGYWRSSRTSTVIEECYEADSCTGGSEDYCKSGYDGPFCAVCADDYADGSGYTCSKCNGARTVTTVLVGLVLFAVAVILGAASVNYLGSSTKLAAAERLQRTCQARLEGSILSQGLKIVIVSWQIVSQFSSVASVTYPDVYETFVGYINFIKLDLAWMLSAKCWFETDFYDSLLTITIGPLVVCGLALASYVKSKSRHLDDETTLKEIKRRHATFIYIISVLVYSTASAAVFQVFPCDELDNGKSFLRADHSIQCDTPTHKVYTAYAAFMCLVYPLGIPACYAAILYRDRNTLKANKTDGKRARPGAPDKSNLTDEAGVFQALSAPYRREVFYYEVVECFRRVTLTGLVVFILPNTAGQVITTFLLSLLFFGVFMGLDPYHDDNPFDKWLDRIGHVIVMMSMFVALAIKVDIEEDDEFSQEVFGGALVVTNCVMVSTLVVQACMMCKDATKQSRDHPIPSADPQRRPRR